MRNRLVPVLSAVLVLLGVLVWSWRGGEIAPAHGDLGREASVARGPAVGGELLEDGAGTIGREAAVLPATAPEGSGQDATEAGVAQEKGQLHFLVRGEDGPALPGCSVRVDDQELVTDREGRAQFEVAPGRWHVVVAPPAGFELQPRRGWQTVRAGVTTEVEVVLAPLVRTVFWCRVVAAEDGRGLADVDAKLLPAGTRSRSDAAGYVQIALLQERVWLDLSVAGRSPCRVVPTPDHGTRESALLVPLATACALRVLVTDTAAAPVAGCAFEVRVRPWDLQVPREQRACGEDFAWSASTDLEGRLSLADVPTGVPLVVNARVPQGFASFAEQRWSLSSAEEQRTIVLESGGTVHGIVVDGGGQPVAGVRVQADAAADARAPRLLVGRVRAPQAQSGADGRFVIGGLGPGTWWVGTVFGEGHRPSLVQVELAAAGRADVELRVAKGLPLAGRAVRADGRGAARVPLQLMIGDEFAANVQTDADGRFRFEDLPEGDCELMVEAYETELGLVEPMTVTAGDEAVLLQLVAVSGTLSGRVYGSTDAWILAMRRDSEDALGSRCELDGSFCYRGMRAGTWDLVAEDRTGKVAWVAGIEVLGGREVSGLSFELGHSALLRPRHERADEFVVCRGAQVAARDNLQLGIAGDARVPPGAWTVVFRSRGREIARCEVEVQAGQQVLVDGS
ncbi:MAG: carboxypeptidase regulatory-like domain-containing protein [Planctomycetes bacterium]|nr:carboxypeptidase regulatory-like domain-containing protein [Planctomycetota bacterium]